MEKTGCFYILRVSPDATLKEVRNAYMRLVKRWHPDRFADNPQMRESAQEKLKIINAAYEEAKAAISARIERETQKNFSKPSPASSQMPPEDSRTDTDDPLQPAPLFSRFRSNIANRVRRFFGSGPMAAPRRSYVKKTRQEPARPSGVKGDEKDFQKIFDDAVRSKTGEPYRPLKRSKRPIEPKEKDATSTPPNTAYRPLRSRKKTGDRVERVEPISKIKGL